MYDIIKEEFLTSLELVNELLVGNIGCTSCVISILVLYHI